MRALLVILLFTSSAFGASFDCAKASTPVEKIICESPRLSALDDELAATYAAALKIDRDAVRASQRRWLAEDRNQCDYDGCLEASYLLRIAILRVANRPLFARQKPPAKILGRYSQMQENCHPSEEDPNDNVCEGELENFVDIRRTKGNALEVNAELWFYMGHTCSIESAPAEWVNDELRVAMPGSTGDPECVLILRFENETVEPIDLATRCKDLFCGSRGGFNDFVLAKKRGK